jgi:hypothetical protein
MAAEKLLSKTSEAVSVFIIRVESHQRLMKTEMLLSNISEVVYASILTELIALETPFAVFVYTTRKTSYRSTELALVMACNAYISLASRSSWFHPRPLDPRASGCEIVPRSIGIIRRHWCAFTRNAFKSKPCVCITCVLKLTSNPRPVYQSAACKQRYGVCIYTYIPLLFSWFKLPVGSWRSDFQGYCFLETF